MNLSHLVSKFEVPTMQASFWELFVQRVTTNPRAHISAELNRLAEEVAVHLAALGADNATAAGALSALNEQIASRYSEIQNTAAGAPKPVPVPPEMIAAANRTFNEAEVLEAIRDIEAGRGRKFEDVIDQLDALPSKPGDSQS